MKAGDDVGKVYRKQLLDHDPILERNRKLSNWAFLLISIYLLAHIGYALYN